MKLVVNNLNEFMEIIYDKKMKNYYFRGENKKFSDITSSLLRRSKSLLSKQHFYNMIINTYFNEVATNIDQFERDNFLAFSQHHGLWTNLIDFTTSPLVALYFACEKYNKTGYVYLINKNNTIEISELVNQKCTPPKNCYNIVDLLISDDRETINYLKEYLISYFWDHDNIQHFIDSVCNCCLKFPDSSIIKSFANEYYAAKKDSFVQAQNGKGFDLSKCEQILNHYFRSLDISGMPSNLCEYLTLIYLYFSDISAASFFMPENYDEFPEIPYFIYKTPYKFDRIRNQEGIFLYQNFKSYALHHEDLIDNITIQKIHPDITIEVHNQALIRNQLDYVGINRKFIYGDNDNIAQYVNNKFIDNIR